MAAEKMSSEQPSTRLHHAKTFFGDEYTLKTSVNFDTINE